MVRLEVNSSLDREGVLFFEGRRPVATPPPEIGPSYRSCTIINRIEHVFRRLGLACRGR